MANIKIKTSGMHCQSCEKLVKIALEEIPGINKVESSFKLGIVSVDFDEKKTNPTQIKSMIKKEGYEAQ
jgi:copper chaperone CopZ